MEPNTTRKCERVLKSINARCLHPGSNGYKRYGGRGIKNLLTLPDLIFMWHRDGAAKMKRPSIDRIDNDGNYTLTNCRFMELSDNIKRGRAGRQPRKGKKLVRDTPVSHDFMTTHELT